MHDHTTSYEIIQYHTLSYMCAKAFGSSQPPKSCEWSHHAGVGSLQSTSAWSPKNSSRTACRNHSDFQGAWKFGACWYPFGLWCIIGCSCESMTELPLFFQFPLRLTHLSPDRINFWQADLLIFSTLWWWCFVSLLQERDEYSEVARIHALEEKYKAEVSQLAKDSQAVSSVSHENTDI